MIILFQAIVDCFSKNWVYLKSKKKKKNDFEMFEFIKLY